MGSNPIHAITPMAQWTTRSTSNRKIVGSNPTVGKGVFFIKALWFLTANFIIAYLARGREFDPRPLHRARVAQW